MEDEATWPKIDVTVRLDVLGKWQQPILDAIERTFSGAKAGYAPLPNGQACLVVQWEGFKGQDNAAREHLIRDVIAGMGSDAPSRVSTVLAQTPDEISRQLI
jgi:hypothetical protein